MLHGPGIPEFREEVRAWFRENLPPDWNTPAFQPPTTEEEATAFLRDWQRLLYEGGWAGLAWPREYGGRGATLLEQAVFQEERDRVKAPHDLASVGTQIVGPMLIHHGTPAQRDRYLQPILSGGELWCQGFSEPDAGSDLASLRTKAVRTDGSWTISGQKIWTSRAAIADQMILLARTDPTAPKHHGIGAFVVPMDSPGIDARPIRQMNGSSEFCEVFLDHVEVADQNRIGGETDGWRVAIDTLAFERIASTRSYEMRRLFRDMLRSLPSATDLPPDTISEVGRHFCDAHASVLLFHRVLTRVLRTGLPGPEASVTKLQSSELSQRLMRTAMSALAPESLARVPSPWMGEDVSFIWEFINTFKHTIAAGTSEVQRNIIGERVLGLPR